MWEVSICGCEQSWCFHVPIFCNREFENSPHHVSMRRRPFIINHPPITILTPAVLRRLASNQAAQEEEFLVGKNPTLLLKLTLRGVNLVQCNGFSNLAYARRPLLPCRGYKGPWSHE